MSGPMTTIGPERSAGPALLRVEERSAALRRELGLSHLVLAQLLIVLGPFGLATAARVGPSHVVVWLLAIVFFYLPLTSVVIYLNKLMPLEGGLYQWAKFGFNELTGFMVAWNYWVFGILFISSVGLSAATGLSYAAGPSGAWMAGSNWVIVVAGLVVTSGLVAVAVRGLGVGKWVHDAGGAIQMLVFALLLALPILAALMHDQPNGYASLSLVMPALSLLNLTLFVKTAVFGLGGFEYVAILAGECRQPGRTIGLSVMVAAPLIAVLSILGTQAFLTYVRPEDVDMINPLAQGLSAGLGPFGRAATYLVPAVVVAMLVREIAQHNILFTGNTRLPMVAGWDRLLPAWFTRLHPVHKTPINSIYLCGLLVLAFVCVGLIGVGAQEAYQLLLSATGIMVATTNLVMFAVPLFGLRSQRPRPPVWLRIAAASGFLMVLSFIVLSVFPVIEVESPGAYAAKIGAVVVAAEAIGASLFVAARRAGRQP
jgi:amino acid transporter